MFSVTVDNVEYKVEFQHFNPSDPTISKNVVKRRDFGTSCYLFRDDRQISQGHTWLHPNDFHSYKKNYGRKEALTRALRFAFSGEDNKETRRKFWQAYYEARGEKW